MQKLLTYLQILAGTAIAALAVNLFLLPNQLTTGGLNGLLIVLHYVWDLPIGLVYLAANLVSIYWLRRLYGWTSLFKQLWGILTFSAALELTRPFAAYSPTANLLLAAIYGGVVMGLGLGLALRVGGSTGGSTSIAQIVHHYTGLNVSKFLFGSDLVVLALGALVVGVEAVLYGMITTYLVIRVLHLVQEGFTTSRCILIISEQSEAVASAVLTEIQRGVTRLSGQGGYSGDARPVLMCVVSETEVPRLRRIVLDADPYAFVVVMEAREVAGRGFTLDTDVRHIPFWVTQRGA